MPIKDELQSINSAINFVDKCLNQMQTECEETGPIDPRNSGWSDRKRKLENILKNLNEVNQELEKTSSIPYHKNRDHSEHFSQND